MASKQIFRFDSCTTAIQKQSESAYNQNVRKVKPLGVLLLFSSHLNIVATCDLVDNYSLNGTSF